MSVIIVIGLIAMFIYSLTNLGSNGDAEIIMLAISGIALYHIFKAIAESAETGSYKEINSVKAMRKYHSEKVGIKTKYGKERMEYMLKKGHEVGFVLWQNSEVGKQEWAELRALDEKYAVPGSEAYKEIRRKEAERNAKK